MNDQLVTDAEIEERIEAERAWAGRPDYRRTLDMRALLDLKVARAREAEYRDALEALLDGGSCGNFEEGAVCGDCPQCRGEILVYGVAGVEEGAGE